MDWDADVDRHFERMNDLSTPWRWTETCPDLGRWLAQVRASIERGRDIDLTQAPKPFVNWIRLPSSQQDQLMAQLRACRDIPSNAANTVAIHQFEAQCNRTARSLAPMYTNIETIECGDLMKAARNIESTSGFARVEAVVDFAAECSKGVRQELKTILGALQKGRFSNRKRYKHDVQLDLLAKVKAVDSLEPVLPALETIMAIPGKRPWRRELYNAMCQSLREFATEKHESLEAAAWVTRNRTRRIGRKIGQRVVGRTLLVKGLEFDHCVLLDADALKARDLYVAMTRATTSLTILSKNPILKPSR